MIKKNTSAFDILVKSALITLVIGLFFSNALKSIALVVLALSSVFLVKRKKDIFLSIKHPLVLSTICIIIIYCVSAMLSSNKLYAWISIKNKLAIVFAIIAIMQCKFDKNEIKYFLFVIIMCALLQSIYASYFYFNIDEWNNMYHVGNVLPTIKIHHVQIGVLIAITILILYHFILKEKNKIHKIAMLIAGIFLFIFLHIFAVRTGIVLLYFMLLFYTIYKCIIEKKWKYIVGIITVLSISSISALQFSDTLKSKLEYMKYDISQFRMNSENMHEYSDARRLLSIKNGIEIWKNNWYLGCGIGDIYDECKKINQIKNPSVNEDLYYLPHSQYLYFYSVFGIILGSIVILCFIFPAFYFIYKKNNLFSSIYVALLIFSIWDAYFGTLFGVCIYTVVIAIGSKKTI